MGIIWKGSTNSGDMALGWVLVCDTNQLMSHKAVISTYIHVYVHIIYYSGRGRIPVIPLVALVNTNQPQTIEKHTHTWLVALRLCKVYATWLLEYRSSYPCSGIDCCFNKTSCNPNQPADYPNKHRCGWLPLDCGLPMPQKH